MGWADENVCDCVGVVSNHLHSPSGRVGLSGPERVIRFVKNARLSIAKLPHPAATASDLPKGIGLYTLVFTLPPGGSSDSEGRAAASPVFAFSLP